jgi:membrane-anchored mycosin MYCP
MPISGTSYAAPVVSGIVALVRSRSPELTARQVIRRIEETAHRPAAGWDPVVGHGIVDALAAVSGDTTPAGERTQPRPISNPDATPIDHGAQHFAISGAAVCLTLSTATVAVTAAASRLRRSREAVTRD